MKSGLSVARDENDHSFEQAGNTPPELIPAAEKNTPGDESPEEQETHGEIEEQDLEEEEPNDGDSDVDDRKYLVCINENGEPTYVQEFSSDINALCLEEACLQVLTALRDSIKHRAQNFGIPEHILSAVVEDSFNYNLHGLPPRPPEVFANDLALNFDFWVASKRRNNLLVMKEIGSKYSNPIISSLLKRGLGLVVPSIFDLNAHS